MCVRGSPDGHRPFILSFLGDGGMEVETLGVGKAGMRIGRDGIEVWRMGMEGDWDGRGLGWERIGMGEDWEETVGGAVMVGGDGGEGKGGEEENRTRGSSLRWCPWFCVYHTERRI